MNPLTVRIAPDLRRSIQIWWNEGLSVGFVPTMGALHEGHLSLVRLALENADRCVVSIFVNPAQFAPHEDFDSYPRTEEEDLEKLVKTGAHLVYFPAAEEIYPHGMKDTDVRAGEAAQGLETDFRPHFFDGVVNVVSRLFDQVQPDIAVFGEKDYQQLRVITEMTEQLRLPVKIIGGPIMRDEEGLALSSRNAYLSAAQLKIARQLNKILFETASSVMQAPGENILHAAKEKLHAVGFDKVDYLETRWNRLLAAVWIGKTRLIDNIKIN